MQLTFLHGVHQVSQPSGMEDVGKRRRCDLPVDKMVVSGSEELLLSSLEAGTDFRK